MAETNKETKIDYQDQLKRANNLHDTLVRMYDENRAQVTTAEAQTENLNKQSQAAYRQQQIESQKAQNQFAQNQQANQLSALDAIRRSNASAIANGANAGLSAANQLSAILGLQEETSDAATELANTDIVNAAILNTQLNKNAAEGQRMANELNATLDDNAAELAKSLATNADTVANLVKLEQEQEQRQLDRESQERIAETQAKKELQEDADKKAELNAQRDSLSGTLDNWVAQIDQGFNPTKYWDPFQNKFIENGNKKDFKATVTRLKNGLIEAYTSGDVKKIEDWTEKLNNFNSRVSTEDGGCLIPGSLIRLADGTDKAVENITEEDELLVWDSLQGMTTSAKVLFNEHGEKASKEVVTLGFSDDTCVEFLDDHGFFDITLGKYVYMHNEADSKIYIGHKFLKINEDGKTHKIVKLLQVLAKIKETEFHCPCTIRHMCYYVNGILTIPGNTHPFVNTFKINKKTYAYDPNDMIKCLRKYGYFTAKDFAEYLPAEMFYAFQGEFLKVKIEKGETSMEEILALIKRYAQYLIK